MGRLWTSKDNARKSVMAIFPTRGSVEVAVERLRESGFRNEDVSVLLPVGDTNKDLAHEKHTKLPEGTTVGAASGAVLGGTLGWLAGVGTLALAGLGPLVAAGPIMALLAGAGTGGTIGAIAGALVGMGIPEYEARRYEGRIKKGGILVSVHCDNSDWTSRAKDILESSGGEDISSTGESSADWDETDKPHPAHKTY